MKCPKCGKEIDANSKFCEYCGTQIKKNRKPLFITIAIVACLLILGGIGLTQYNKGEQERTRLERELSMYKLKAEEAELKANAEHEARLKAEAEIRLEREAAEKAKYNGHEYVDLGLPSGLKWATCNASSEFISPDTNDEAFDDIGTYMLYDMIPESCKYWGGSWRLPTKDEMQELIDNCTWSWITQNGIKGYKVIGTNGNSIFLPAAGFFSYGFVYGYDSIGYYWSSTPCDYENYTVHTLNFDSNSHHVSLHNFFDTYTYSQREGLYVRLVAE